MAKTTVRIGWEHRDQDYELLCEVSAGLAGQTYGPPERCYPAEPPEVEVLEVADTDGNVIPSLLGAAQADIERIEVTAIEAAEDKVLAMMEDAS